MAASPRDLLKPRSQRLMEVCKAIQQQDGFADSVYVAYPATIGTPGTGTLPAGSWVFAGGLIGTATAAIAIAAPTAVAPFSGVTIGANGVLTAAGPFAASAFPANFVPVNEYQGGAVVVDAYDAGYVSPASNGF